MRRISTACCWFLFVGAALTAQDAASLRGDAIGEVRDRDGKPWVGAEVVLRSRPLPSDIDAGDEDVVTAVVDERGRFHAAVLRGRAYSAWAWAAPDAAGRRATDVVENAFAQRALALRETRALIHRRVVLAEAARWPDAKFVLRVVDHTGNRGVQWLDVHDGTAELPWLAGGVGTVDLFAVQKDRRVPLRRESLAADAVDLHLEVPNKQHTTCWVRESGTPCADAEVSYQIGDSLFAAGHTDADGKLELDLPEQPVTAQVVQLIVRGEGIAAGCFGKVERNAVGPAPDLPPGAQLGDRFANVGRGSAVSLRVLDGNGKPATDCAVWAAGMAAHHPSRSSGMYGSWRATVHADAHGEVRLPGRLDTAHLLLDQRTLATLPPSWRAGFAPIAFAPRVGAEGNGSAKTPFVVDLRRMCPLELRLTLPNGDPAALAEVTVVTLDPYESHPYGDDLHADHVGRVRMLVPSDIHLGVRAVHGDAILIRSLATFGGHTDAGPAVVTLRLPPPSAIHGRLVDKAGSPLAGHVISPSFGTDNQPMQWSWTDEPDPGPATANRAHVLLPTAERERLMLTGLIGHQAMTDVDGRFVVPLPADPLAQLVLFQSLPDAKARFDSIVVSWEGKPIDDLVFSARF